MYVCVFGFLCVCVCEGKEGMTVCGRDRNECVWVCV